MKRAHSSSVLFFCIAIASCAMDESVLAPPDEAELQVPPASPDVAGDVTRQIGLPTPDAVCGDGTCTPNVEGCGNCPSDCPCWQQGTICSGGVCVPICGDNFCAPSMEDCGSCPVDCPCPGGTECQNHQCVSDPCGGDPCCGDICCRKPWLCEPQVP